MGRSQRYESGLSTLGSNRRLELSVDALQSSKIVSQKSMSTKPSEILLTVHDHAHILHKLIDDIKGLCCSRPGLILREPIYSPQHRLNLALF